MQQRLRPARGRRSARSAWSATAERYGFNSPAEPLRRAAAAAVDPPQSTIPTSIPDDARSRGERDRPGRGAGDAAGDGVGRADDRQRRRARAPPRSSRDRTLQPAAKPVRVTSAQIATTVRDLMIQVVKAGRGRRPRCPGVQVAGKTGTAELGPKPLEPGRRSPARRPSRRSTPGSPPSRRPSDPKLAAAAMVVNAERGRRHRGGPDRARRCSRGAASVAVRCRARPRRPRRSTTGCRA